MQDELPFSRRTWISRIAPLIRCDSVLPDANPKKEWVVAPSALYCQQPYNFEQQLYTIIHQVCIYNNSCSTGKLSSLWEKWVD